MTASSPTFRLGHTTAAPDQDPRTGSDSADDAGQRAELQRVGAPTSAATSKFAFCFNSRGSCCRGPLPTSLELTNGYDCVLYENLLVELG